jgi:short chain dehydrogenase
MERAAVVTGGAGGIGGAIVRALRDTGHEVAILDRAGEFGVDLADERAVRQIAGRLGPRDVLVHAAAAFDRAGLAELDADTWRRVQAVNVEAALWLCQELTPGMIERGFGRIVFITSNTVWRPPVADFLPYVASKATLVGIAALAGQAPGGPRDHRQLRGPRTDAHPVHRGRPAGRGVRRGPGTSVLATLADTRRHRRRGGLPRHRRGRGRHRPDAVRGRRVSSPLSRTRH